MRKLKITEGASLTGDLSEGTWTFEVKDLELRAGVFAIVRKEDFYELLKERDELLEALKDYTMSDVGEPKEIKRLDRKAHKLIQSIETK